MNSTTKGRTREQRREVLLRLAILGALLKPGRRLTRADIATWCGITPQAVSLIEKRALRKLRTRLQPYDNRASQN